MHLIRICIGLFLCLWVNQLFAQGVNTSQTEKDYRKFSQTLEEEASRLLNDTTTQRTILHPVSLPDWFLSVPPANGHSIWAIGISDPGMEEEKAIHLAKLRAFAVASVLNKSKVSSMSDNFARENKRKEGSDFITRYVNFYQINASLPCDSSCIHIEAQEFNSFGEAIVLLRYDLPTDSTCELASQGNIYQVERQKHNTFESEEKIIFKANLNVNDTVDGQFEYVLYSRNNLFEIKSQFQGQEYNFPYLNFRYVSDTAADQSAIAPVRLNYGLWKAFVDSFFKAYAILSQSRDVNIKQVGDAHTATTQSLARELYNWNPAVSINKISVSNNQISVNLQFIN